MDRIGDNKMYVIGIDPDSVKHGVAVYKNGVLTELQSYSLTDIMSLLLDEFHITRGIEVKFSIENVCANNFIYARNANSNRKVENSIARSIGRNQQAQIELMRVLDYYGVSYELYKPQKGNWAKNKTQFEKITGWDKRSNEDTRSAAYFGYLALGNGNE